MYNISLATDLQFLFQTSYSNEYKHEPQCYVTTCLSFLFRLLTCMLMIMKKWM